MTRLRKLLRLSRPERRLLLQATLVVASVRVGLWLLPLRTLRHALTRLAPSSALPPGPDPFERIAWAVTRASAHVPGATCLTQALAAQTLLERRGYRARLCIGFGRREDSRLQGHAWVESDGRVVLGGVDLVRYSRLPAVAGEGSAR
jgi:hypothetical protein